jgi:hypothetical protein
LVSSSCLAALEKVGIRDRACMLLQDGISLPEGVKLQVEKARGVTSAVDPRWAVELTCKTRV